MVFVDEVTRFMNLFELKTRDEAHKQLKIYQESMKLAGTNIRCTRGVGAGELGRPKAFRQELGNLALQWESSPPYAHQQQGLVETIVFY